MSNKPTNYDGIEDRLEKAYRRVKTRIKRKLERVKERVNNMDAKEFAPLPSWLGRATDETVREWVDEHS